MNSFKNLFYLMGFAATLSACKGPDGGVAPSEPPKNIETALSVSPTEKTIAVNNSLNLTATGGTPPYNYTVASGGGTIVSVVDQGQYTAPSSTSVVTVQVTDSVGASASATITVNSALTISPTSITLMTGATTNLSASGGVPPYFYSIQSGSGSVNSMTGTYTAPNAVSTDVVRVTDSHGNTVDATIQVTSVLALNPSNLQTVVGDVTAFSAVGGTPPYTYSVVSGSGSINSSGSYTAAAAGTDVVRVTDSLGATADSNVNVNAVLAISPTAINMSVSGNLTFTTSGGVSPISFSVVSGGGSVDSATGYFTAPAAAATVVVRATDSAGHTADATVNVSTVLGISPAAITLAVNNSTTFSGTGGVAPYSFSLVSGSGTLNSATGSYTAPATAGSAVVRITDSLGATADANITINAALSIGAATLNMAISSNHTFTATGGVSPYVYSIVSGGGTINSSTGVFTAPGTAGTVVVRVTDSLSNTSNATVTVVSNVQISPSTKILAVNNSFIFTASGGLTPYVYSIVSGGGTINSSTGSYTAPATAGSAVVRVTDALGQTSQANVTVNAALAISPSAVTKAVSSSHTFTAVGGVSPYTYSIVSGGGSINSASGVFSAPATAGSVVVRVTDSLSNTANSTVTIVSNVQISPSTYTMATSATTLFSATGGQTPYAYSIVSGGGVINPSTGSFTAPASAGSVTVRVTDAIGQFSDSAITVASVVTISPTSLTLAVNNSHTFSAAGGVAPYTYSIVSGGGTINSSTGSYTAPATAGSVVVRVTDSLSQFADSNITINAGLSISPATVSLVQSGTQTFSAAGGVAPYTYSVVSGGGTMNSSTGAFTAPATAGSVVVRVTDSLSNTANSNVTVVTPVTISPSSPTLAVNGNLTFTASGGLAPYSYSIVSGGGVINSSTGAFTAPATAGSVVVRVTDSLSQQSSTTVTVNAALVISPATKTLAVNNTFTFSAAGGVAPYTYSIVSGGGTMNSSSGLFTSPSTAGSVIVRVTDSLSNTSNANVTVNAALAISPASSTVAVGNTLTFSATGGVSPYTYSIVSGGGTINSSTGLFTAPATAGSVVVRVTDSLSNTSNATVTVNAALVISPDPVITSVGNSTTFTGTGGVPPYTYSIVSGGGTINSSTGAFTAGGTAGAVVVRVTDSLSNISEADVTVNGPLAISPTTINVVASGSATFVGAGGVAPYTYSIVSGGGSIDSVTGDFTAPATAGSVIVRVTDSVSASVNATVTVYDALTLSPTAVTIGINTVQNFTATGGLGTRTFSIVSGDGTIDPVTGQFTSGISAGETIIEVADTIGNNVEATITVVSSLTISPLTLKLPVFSTATFSATLGTAPYSYSMASGTGSVISGTGVYTGGTVAGIDSVRVTDAGMNTSDSVVTLIEPVQIVGGSNHFCARYNEGSVKCWGLNTSGQLGLGNTTAYGSAANQGGDKLPFVNLGTGRSAKFIASGHTHTCAILDNDQVKCWGLNTSGQLGYGDTTTRGTAATQMGDALPFVNLGTGRTAKKIAAGATHTCAILDNDTLKCWGYNLYGQLGRDNTTNVGTAAGQMGDALAAINLGAGRTAKDISAGLDHTCAILDNNTLKCWGRNNRGQLGKDNVTTLGDTAGEMAALTAINLGAGRTAVAISAGYSHTCAIRDNGTAVCWGLGTTGQLGRDNALTMGDAAGEMNTVMTTPINLGFVPTLIDASRTRTCAMSATGATKCWGLGTSGQLARGNATSYGTAAGNMAALANINFGTSIVASTMASSWYSSCVIMTNKRIKCFGSATNGQLLNASTTLHIGDAAGELGDGMAWVNH